MKKTTNPAIFLKLLNSHNINTRINKMIDLETNIRFELMIENKIRYFEKHIQTGHGVGPLIYI